MGEWGTTGRAFGGQMRWIDSLPAGELPGLQITVTSPENRTMTNQTHGEPVMLDHREWSRDGTHVLTLFHRPGWSNNAWQIRHHHAYAGEGGFGYIPSFNEESEARAYFARTAMQEDAKHAEWLADEAAKGA